MTVRSFDASGEGHLLARSSDGRDLLTLSVSAGGDIILGITKESGTDRVVSACLSLSPEDAAALADFLAERLA